MRTAEIPKAHDEVLAVASKNVGAPTVPALGEATVMVGDAQATPKVRKSVVQANLNTGLRYSIGSSHLLMRNGNNLMVGGKLLMRPISRHWKVHDSCWVACP
jgi:hypothetical protein